MRFLFLIILLSINDIQYSKRWYDYVIFKKCSEIKVLVYYNVLLEENIDVAI